MWHRRSFISWLPVAIFALALTACGGDPSSPSQASDASRRIEIEATDALTFEPATIDVAIGETVTFVVTNSGSVDHEFAVGDDDTNHMMSGSDGMGSGMGDGMMSASVGHGASTRAVALPAGGTAELTVTFDETGEIPYACHVNGHDEAGMVGSIIVS